jgi:hypothetical protein
MNVLISLFLAALFVATFPREAAAYIDPGSGSYLIQILIAGLVGAAFTVRVFWKNLVATFARIFRGRNESRDNDDAN